MPKGSYDMVKKIFRPDLADARQAWINDATMPQERQKREESSFLSYVDAAGRYADFHALRHTTGSWLAAAGVHPKVAQAVMRHRDINLTMGKSTEFSSRAPQATEEFREGGVQNKEGRKTATKKTSQDMATEISWCRLSQGHASRNRTTHFCPRTNSTTSTTPRQSRNGNPGDTFSI